MVRYTIDRVRLAWTDNGNKMWSIQCVRPDDTRWVMQHWAKDEIDAYNIAMRLLEKEQDNA